MAGQAGRPGGLRTRMADRVREVDLMVEDQTMEAGAEKVQLLRVLRHGHQTGDLIDIMLWRTGDELASACGRDPARQPRNEFNIP